MGWGWTEGKLLGTGIRLGVESPYMAFSQPMLNLNAGNFKANVGPPYQIISTRTSRASKNKKLNTLDSPPNEILGLLNPSLNELPAFSPSLEPELDSDSFLGRAPNSVPLELRTKLMAAGLEPRSGRGMLISVPFKSRRKGVDTVPIRTAGSPNPNLVAFPESLNETEESFSFAILSESTIYSNC